MSAADRPPADVYERIARRLKRGGAITISPVSVCHSERGAVRVAKRYPMAAIVRSDDGKTWTVWARNE